MDDRPSQEKTSDAGSSDPNTPIATLLDAQRASWRRGERHLVETYLAQNPDLTRDAEAVLDLIGNEVILREEIGQKPALAEYQRRFPHLSADLEIHFAIDRAMQLDSAVAPTLIQGPTPTLSYVAGNEASAAMPRVAGYELLEVLGRGGMGVVYKARHLSLHRLVALKMMRAGAGAGADAEDLARFRCEAEAVARLQHPNIVQIFEVGGQEDQPYFSLEYVEGGTLAEKLNRAPLPSREGAVLIETLARAMHWAHQHDIVHRDLKPANVLLTPDGTPKIADFGLAKRLANDSPNQTQSGAILGTPNYMAPEQASGNSKAIGPAADVYALGAILYEILTGRPPFRADTPMATVMQVLSDEPSPPRSLSPDLPRDLETICLKCLQKEPAQRYASAEALADDLRRFLNDEPIRARPTSLLERSGRWIRRHPSATFAAGIAVFLMACAIASYGLWLQKWAVRIDYFANYVKRWGVMEGVGPVTADDARHRSLTYKFYSRGGMVEKVEAMNGSGSLTPALDIRAFIGNSVPGGPTAQEECVFEYGRDNDGKLIREIASDRNGSVVWTFLYTKPTTGYFVDEQGFPQARASSGAAYVELAFTPDGFEKEIHYLDRNGKPRPTKHNFYGERREFDPRGLRTRVTYLAAPTKPGAYQTVFSSSVLKHDTLGNLVDEAHFDANDKPMNSRDGVARTTVTYNAQGNWRETAHFGADGRPTLNVAQFFKATSRYDERGNLTEVAYFGPDHNPVLEAYHVAKVVLAHDKDGNLVEKAFFGVDGKPTLHKDGNHKVTTKYNARGDLSELAFLGLDGQPTLHREGKARIAWKYDDRRNVIEEAFFGVDGLPVPFNHSYAKATMKYDAQRRRTEMAYFGTDEKPALFEGYASYQWIYDENGNAIENLLFGVDGKPTLHKDGYMRYIAKYDDRGNRIEETLFGLDNQRVLNSRQHWSKMVCRFDDNSNKIEEKYFDVNDKPILSSNGVAKLTLKYDERRNMIEMASYGLNDESLEHFGIAKTIFKYDIRGNKVEEADFDRHHKPAMHVDGYSKWTAKYDDRQNMIEKCFLDQNDRPFLGPKRGAAKITMRYDERRNWIEAAYYGVNDEPFGANGIAKTTWKFDPRGSVKEEAHFDRHHKPGMNGEGFSRWTAEYDDHQNKVEQRFFGLNGKPIANQFDGAKMLMKYDASRNLIEQAFFGPDDLPRPGVAKMRFQYHPSSEKVAAFYFGPDDKPLPLFISVAVVFPGGQAQHVGLKVGDVLVSYDNEPVSSDVALIYRRRHEIGNTSRELRVLRDGAPMTFAISPGSLGVDLATQIRP